MEGLARFDLLGDHVPAAITVDDDVDVGVLADVIASEHRLVEVVGVLEQRLDSAEPKPAIRPARIRVRPTACGGDGRQPKRDLSSGPTALWGVCEDARVPADQTHDREAARMRIFDGAQTLAAALMKCDRSERWEPLRELILAGLEAGGLGNAPDGTALRSASAELAAAALDARRHAP